MGGILCKSSTSSMSNMVSRNSISSTRWSGKETKDGDVPGKEVPEIVTYQNVNEPTNNVVTDGG